MTPEVYRGLDHPNAVKEAGSPGGGVRQNPTAAGSSGSVVELSRRVPFRFESKTLKSCRTRRRGILSLASAGDEMAETVPGPRPSPCSML